MKSLLLASMAFLALSSSSYALTFNDVVKAEAGASCHGNVCVHPSTQSGGLTVTGSSEGPRPSVCNGQIGYWANPAPGICVIDMKSSPSSWSDTTACSTKTDTISFDPRGGLNGFGIASSSSSKSGHC
jgi:hypothetical protein